MSRISATLESLKQQGKSALIPYVTAGDSHPGLTVPLMHAMVKSGVDAIELGVPFSDPMADGPTIQLACERALKYHTSLHDVLGMVKEFRQTDDKTPVILMGYLNPLEAMGYETFAVAAKESGVDGMLTPSSCCRQPLDNIEFNVSLKQVRATYIMYHLKVSPALIN